MRRVRLSLIAAALVALAAPACSLIFGIEELPVGGAAGASPDGGTAADAGDAADTSDISDANDSGDANDASDTSDASDASDGDSGSPGPCDCPSTQLWAKAFASTADVTVAGVVVAPNGDVAIAGSASGDLDVQGHVMPGGFDHDVFVIVLDACGERKWSRRFGDTGEQSALAIAVDPASSPTPGAIVITGWHMGTLSFGGTTGNLTTLTHPRAFVARLDGATGDGIQAISAGMDPQKAYRGTSVATLANGGALWAGTEADDTGIFVRQLNPSLSVTQEIAPPCSQCDVRIAPTPGGAALAGWFQGTLDLVAGGGGVIAALGVDALVATLVPQAATFSDTNRKAFGDNQAQRATGMVSDASGNLYVVGDFAGKLIMTTTHMVTSTGGLDAFVAKLDGTLASQWLVGFGGAAADQSATAVALGSRLWVAGDFAGSLSAGTLLQGAGGTDAFLLALDPADGSVKSAISFGSALDDHAAGVAVDASGNAVVAGVIGAPTFFGCGTLGGAGKSIFVAKRPIP